VPARLPLNLRFVSRWSIRKSSEKCYVAYCMLYANSVFHSLHRCGTFEDKKLTNTMAKRRKGRKRSQEDVVSPLEILADLAEGTFDSKHQGGVGETNDITAATDQGAPSSTPTRRSQRLRVHSDVDANDVHISNRNDMIESTTKDKRPESDDESESPPPKRRKNKDKDKPENNPRMNISNRHSPRTWDERYQVLVEFKEQYGHTNVPSRDTGDRGLAEFVTQLKNKPQTLSKDQKQKLDDIGFDWTNGKDKQDQSWDDNLALLKRFHERHGHFKVQKFTVYQKLYSWLCRQRMMHSKGSLRTDRK
jgi:hypothetical protein